MRSKQSFEQLAWWLPVLFSLLLLLLHKLVTILHLETENLNMRSLARLGLEPMYTIVLKKNSAVSLGLKSMGAMLPWLLEFGGESPHCPHASTSYGKGLCLPERPKVRQPVDYFGTTKLGLRLPERPEAFSQHGSGKENANEVGYPACTSNTRP